MLRCCSIEEAKQKAEYDKKLLLAEQKKMSMRETIQAMRDEFQKLVARNKELPPHLALSHKVSLVSLLDDWIVQCLTSPPTQYRLYGRLFLQVKRPDQQYQSIEGESCKGKQHKQQKENKN